MRPTIHRFGRQVPFAYLLKLKEEFLAKHADRSRTALPNSLDKIFGCAAMFLLCGWGSRCGALDTANVVVLLLNIARHVDFLQNIHSPLAKYVVPASPFLSIHLQCLSTVRSWAVSRCREAPAVRNSKRACKGHQFVLVSNLTLLFLVFSTHIWPLLIFV